MTAKPTIAAFRPPGERAEQAHATLTSLGVTPLIDPMVEPAPTGALPRDDCDITILTSSTAADILEAEGWSRGEAELVAIGPKTADALERVGIEVDRIPATYTSAGLVEELSADVDGRRVEIARSDHGSDELQLGLWAAGAYVHETVLYRLRRPGDAGHSVSAVIDGEVDGIAFTSSLTVEHFIDIARDRGVEDDIHEAIEHCIVGVIGPPTAETASDTGIAVDVIASEATFETLASEVVDAVKATTFS